MDPIIVEFLVIRAETLCCWHTVAVNSSSTNVRNISVTSVVNLMAHNRRSLRDVLCSRLRKEKLSRSRFKLSEEHVGSRRLSGRWLETQANFINSLFYLKFENNTVTSSFEQINILNDFGRPFVKRFALCYRTVVLSVCLSCLSVCNVRVLWSNGWMDQYETWHGGRPRPRPQYVRWRPSSPPPKGDTAAIFAPYLLWPNGWMDQDATWYEVNLGSGDVVLDGVVASP